MILYHQWLQLPLHQRHKIAEDFGIVKKGGTEVFNDTIKSDGYLVKDLEEALTVENMQKYLETNETDPVKLWDFLIHGKPEPAIEATPEPVEIEKPPKVTKPMGRPKKK